MRFGARGATSAVVRLHQLALVGFVLLAALAVHEFVRMAMTAEQKRVCTPLCALGPAYADLDRVAPDFDLPSLDGERVRLGDLRGRVVVLNFWTQSCQPCQEELPSLAALAEAAAARGIAVVTVSTDDDTKDTRDTLQRWLGRPAPFLVLHDPEATVVTGKFGTRLYPETWILDREGVIRARFDGARDWAEPMVLELLDTIGERQRCQVRFADGRRVSGPPDVCAGPWPVVTGS